MKGKDNERAQTAEEERRGQNKEKGKDILPEGRDVTYDNHCIFTFQRMHAYASHKYRDVLIIAFPNGGWLTKNSFCNRKANGNMMLRVP